MSAHALSKKDTRSLHYVVRSGIAGGVAGCIAKTVVAPLDRVKILFQTSSPDFSKYAGTWSGVFKAVQQIHGQEGVRGLFQGHSATLLRIFPYAAIKFMAYDQLENILMPTKEKQTNLRRFTAGALSGMTSVFFTYPLELIRVRMAFQTRPTNGARSTRQTFLQAISQIYHEQPIRSAPTSPLSEQPVSRAVFHQLPILKFYRGFTVSIAGMIPYAGTSFLAWGYLRSKFIPPRRQNANPIADLGFGALAGAVAQTASYPFEVVRRRMQVGGLTHPDRWLGWEETVRGIWRERGWRGFYVGLSIGYLKVIPMTAVSFAVWQEMKRLLDV